MLVGPTRSRHPGNVQATVSSHGVSPAHSFNHTARGDSTGQVIDDCFQALVSRGLGHGRFPRWSSLAQRSARISYCKNDSDAKKAKLTARKFQPTFGVTKRPKKRERRVVFSPPCGRRLGTREQDCPLLLLSLSSPARRLQHFGGHLFGLRPSSLKPVPNMTGNSRHQAEISLTLQDNHLPLGT